MHVQFLVVLVVKSYVTRNIAAYNRHPWKPYVYLLVRLNVGGSCVATTVLRMGGIVDPERSAPRLRAA